MNGLKVKDWYERKAEFDLDGILGVVSETEKAVQFLVEEFAEHGVRNKTVWCPKSVILDEDWKNYYKVNANIDSEGNFKGYVYEDGSPVIGSKFFCA